jgi:hypothetical protein
MDAILYIQAAREELTEAKPQPEAFRPPHPSDAENILSVNSPLPGEELEYGSPV